MGVPASETKNNLDMKTNIILASAALSVICCLYFVRLNDAAEQNASSSARVNVALTNPTSEVATPVEPSATASVTAVSSARLKTTRNERTISAERNSTVKCKRGTKEGKRGQGRDAEGQKREIEGQTRDQGMNAGGRQ